MLTVIHQPLADLPQMVGADFSSLCAGPSFRLQTCQRVIWVHGEETPDFYPKGSQLFANEDAYRFLLQLSTGLESAVMGETDIFGQVKEAWRLRLESGEPVSPSLVGWMRFLFEDTKTIRAEHLQNSGGNTYGGLVRKLLRRGDAPTSILLAGAGQLARSVKPHLTSFARDAGAELVTWNRTPSELAQYAGEGQFLELLARASHAVLCIPGSPGDSDRIRAWNAGAGQVLLHLGQENTAAWSEARGYRSLQDIFALAKNDGESAQKFERAKQACAEKARLRFLSARAGASLSLAHGWEDLLAFN